LNNHTSRDSGWTMSGKQDPQEEESSTALTSFFQTLSMDEEQKNIALKTITLIDDTARLPHESLRPWNTTSTPKTRPCFYKALSTGSLSDHQQDRWNAIAVSPLIAAPRRPPFSHSDSPNSVMSVHQKHAKGTVPSLQPFAHMQRSNDHRQLNLNRQTTSPLPPTRKPF
jgi:hypothetical protein